MAEPTTEERIKLLDYKINELKKEVEKNSRWRKIQQWLIVISLVVSIEALLYYMGG